MLFLFVGVSILLAIVLLGVSHRLSQVELALRESAEVARATHAVLDKQRKFLEDLELAVSQP